MKTRHSVDRGGTLALAIVLALAMLSGLTLHLAAGSATAQEWANPRPLTADGRSRRAAWSPDGETVLVARWGRVVGEGPPRQALSELWAVDVRDGSANRLSENALRPVYAPDGERLAYLSYVGEDGGQWHIQTLDLATGEEQTVGPADWRQPPAWSDAGEAVQRRPGERHTLPVDGRATGFVTSMAWSPDGERLAYVSFTDSAPSTDGAPSADGATSTLWLVDAAGAGAPRRLARRSMATFSRPSWSPDGRTLAFSIQPWGAETAAAADVWLVETDDPGSERLLFHSDLEERNPAWSPDGRYLAFERAGDVWLFDLAREPTIPESTPTPDACSLPSARAPLVQQTPPETIRVIHREANVHRDLPPGQIDEIPFEAYVKRCVPVEVYASWPMEALKSQAMAARTYAWHYTIVRAGEDWHVSDWTDYQAMGRDDQRHPRSDAAVDATRGQYVAYEGAVIKAFYSAENGSPTRSATGYDYIQPVDDPVGFGQERRGHGWGMSQWGAYRWAAWRGWGYQQILAHYYTGVTIELPATGGPLPLGGLTLPWSDHFVTGDRIYLRANASDELGDVRAVGFYAAAPHAASHALTETLIATDTVDADGWGTVWDVSALTDTASTGITLSLRVVDGAGHVQRETQGVRIGLDRRPPTATWATVNDVYPQTVTVTLALSATDPAPGSGMQSVALGDGDWAWEGEHLLHEIGSGAVVTDADALNGLAWQGRAGVHDPGGWYGPYTTALPPGYAYRAYFRLKSGDAMTTAQVATLDVVDGGGARLLGLRHLRGTDFRAAGVYQEFPVDFDYAEAGTMGLEFRVAFYATADLTLDRVLVVAYPLDFAPSAQWRLPPEDGCYSIVVKFIDGAGNVSDDLVQTVTLDRSPPTDWNAFSPTQWDGGPPPTFTVRVWDAVSGIDVDSGRYRFTKDGGATWSAWLTATSTGVSGTTALQTLSTAPVPFELPWDTANRVQFRIADMVGLTSTATFVVRGPVRVEGPSSCELGDVCEFTARIEPLTGTVSLPVTYTWQATDWLSVTHVGGGLDRTAFSWTIPGPKAVTLTVRDAGGDVGGATHRVFACWRVYLPLTLRQLPGD